MFASLRFRVDIKCLGCAYEPIPHLPHCKAESHESCILFGDTMVPNIEWDYILLLGDSILYKDIILLG